MIPADTDVLITHGPPAGILDMTPSGKQAGCQDLLDVIDIVQPRMHVFGHIHHSYGVTEHKGTKFVNASTCTEKYTPDNKPLVIDLW